jgi:transposase
MVIDEIDDPEEYVRRGERMLKVTEGQLQELEGLMKRAPKAHIRRKATALWNLAQGRSQRQVAAFLGASRASIVNWKKRFETEGVAGLGLRPGRGRPRRAQSEEIEVVLRQSPRNFGIQETRWTLSSLAHVVPSLEGFTDSGVWRALRRSGLSYKRGQPLVHSPDRAYDLKRGLEGSASRSLPEPARDSAPVHG